MSWCRGVALYAEHSPGVSGQRKYFHGCKLGLVWNQMWSYLQTRLKGLTVKAAGTQWREAEAGASFWRTTDGRSGRLEKPVTEVTKVSKTVQRWILRDHENVPSGNESGKHKNYTQKHKASFSHCQVSKNFPMSPCVSSSQPWRGQHCTFLQRVGWTRKRERAEHTPLSCPWLSALL